LYLEDDMAYDEGLAQRIREVLDEQPGLVEKKMFGGIAFMLQGNMACGVVGDELMVRVGPEQYQETLARPYTRPFDFTGRPMQGWVVVTPDGVESDESLRDWVQQGVEFALSLPAK
jgi:TfoX/Sxy family transcriptional regulator of competence genes